MEVYAHDLGFKDITWTKTTRRPRIPSRLRQIADASGGRIVIAGVGSPPENGPAKKGIKM